MNAATQVDVLVVGESLIDIIRGERTSEHVGGSPANVALGLGRLGVSTALLTQFGKDPHGERILAHLSGSNVQVLRQTITAASTATAAAEIEMDGHATYTFDIHWRSFDAGAIPPARVVHTGSIATFLQPGAAAVRELLLSSEAELISYDPNIRPAIIGSRASAIAAFRETARLANVVKMSDEDAAWLYPNRDQNAVMDAILELGPDLVAITLGPLGASLSTRSDRIHVSGIPTIAVDTIGAGDSFMASMIRSLLQQGLPTGTESLEALGRAASTAASITVSRAGADLPWLHELAQTRRQHQPFASYLAHRQSELEVPPRD